MSGGLVDLDPKIIRFYAESRGLAVVSSAAIREWMDAAHQVERAVFESERARAMDRLRRAREAVEAEMKERQ